MTHIVIVDGIRTPFAEWNGKFSDISAIDLAARCVQELLKKVNVPSETIDHVVIGNALQTSGDAIYGARHVALKGGLPIETPAVTVNRLCGSGIQSIIQGVHMIMLGEAKWVIAGGMENMTQAPHVIWGLRKGLRLGEGSMHDLLWLALRDSYCGYLMAETAENLARKMGISREEQDEFAFRSHQRAQEATRNGWFKEEIIPYEFKTRKGSEIFDYDDHIRFDTSLEKLLALRPYFSRDGFVTAGNASGIVDGAAVVLLTTEEEAKASGLKPLGRIIAWGYAGVEPDIMGIGPVPAIKEALDRAGLTMDDIDRWEINEAFAAQYLAVEKTLELEREKVNVHGGAIAIGHPLAATGTRLVYTVLRQLRAEGLQYGVASACIGGGQGIALVVEAIKD